MGAKELSMKRAYIIAGGSINKDFAQEFLNKKEEFSIIVAVDAGLELLDGINIMPDVLIGDFDTVDYDVLNKYIDAKDIIIQRHNPIKDASDTELAVDVCENMGYTDMYLIGGFGGRMDHSLANIYLACSLLERNISMTIVDRCNKVYAKNKSFSILKKEQWGKYLSIYPMMQSKISDFSIEGVKYPLANVILDKYKNPTYTISNEIVDEVANIKFEEGLILVIESRDLK